MDSSLHVQIAQCNVPPMSAGVAGPAGYLAGHAWLPSHPGIHVVTRVGVVGHIWEASSKVSNSIRLKLHVYATAPPGVTWTRQVAVSELSVLQYLGHCYKEYKGWHLLSAPLSFRRRAAAAAIAQGGEQRCRRATALGQ